MTIGTIRLFIFFKHLLTTFRPPPESKALLLDQAAVPFATGEDTGRQFFRAGD